MGRTKPPDGQLRRRPSGPQGEAIVRAVIEATGQILEAEGYRALTTNRIARTAGVSIGSFYRYFPDKDAVVAEMARALEHRAFELARSRLAELAPDAGVAAATDALIDVVLGRGLGNARLRRILQEQVPRAWVRAASAETDGRVRVLVRDFIVSRRSEVDPELDPAVAAFVLVTAVEAVAETAVASQALDAKGDELREALRRLVLRYLGAAAP